MGNEIAVLEGFAETGCSAKLAPASKICHQAGKNSSTLAPTKTKTTHTLGPGAGSVNRIIKFSFYWHGLGSLLSHIHFCSLARS